MSTSEEEHLLKEVKDPAVAKFLELHMKTMKNHSNRMDDMDKSIVPMNKSDGDIDKDCLSFCLSFIVDGSCDGCYHSFHRFVDSL